MSFRQALGAAVVIIGASIPETVFAQGTPEIRVLVYDYTGKSGDVPLRALAEAARVLNKAGISIRWIACPKSSDEMSRFPDCRVQGTNTIVLRIIAKPGRGAGPIGPTTLGITMGTTYVTIYGDRVRTAAMTAQCSEDIVLGYAITHELGHALLGTSAHRKEGPMKPWWTVSDLKLAEARLLQFSPEECARMRAEVMRRTAIVARGPDRGGDPADADSVRPPSP